MLNRIKALFNPEQYHGWGRKRRYFEGWYYKLVTEGGGRSLAIIPGIAMSDLGSKHSFIQILDGTRHEAEYNRFHVEDFEPVAGRFELAIGANRFSLDQISLALSSAKGNVHLSDLAPWPNSWFSPGVMGPFAFVPFMQCYHGVLSMDHRLEGELEINGESIDFTDGRGYMEKDWGQSFPSAYAWMQSNHFEGSGISVKASIARIPWMGTAFVGFIAGILMGDRLIEFTTYNFTRLRKCHIDMDLVEIVLENPNHRIELSVKRGESTELAAPILGMMDARISESMCSEIEVILTDRKNGTVAFHGHGKNACLEVAGNIEEIVTK